MKQYNTTAEWNVFLQDIQQEAWIDTMASWVREAILPPAEPSIDVALAFLQERGMSPEVVIGVEKILNGEAGSSIYDCIEIHMAQWVVGQALATLFFHSSEKTLALLHMVPDWHCWEGFCSRLSQELVCVDNAAHLGRRFMEAVVDLEANPQDYCMFKSDERHFLSLNEIWKNESDISEIWNPTYGWQYLTMHLPAFSTLKVLLPNYTQVLVDILEKISYPPIVNDILWVCLSTETSQELLRQASSCIALNSDRKPVWNRKLLAPLLLEWCATYGTHTLAKVLRNGASVVEVDEAKARLVRLYAGMVAALVTREDKYFLGGAFLAEILARRVRRGDVERDPQAQALFLLGNALKESLALPAGGLSDTLFKDTFGVAEEEATAQAGIFAQTGIFLPQCSGLRLTLLLTLVERTPELTENYARRYLRFFNLLLCFKNAGLYTSEHSEFPDERHEKMALVYAAMTDPQANWLETWQKLSGIRYKLRYLLFSEESNDQRYVLNFVLVCGVSVCRLLAKQGEIDASHALLAVVKQRVADYSHWDWVQERFFDKIKALIERDDNEQSNKQ